MLSRGAGYLLWDVDGREYIDGTSSALSASCGHGHPYIRRAVEAQLARLPHYDLSTGSHEPSGLLAERLAGLMPAALSHTLFVNSGSEGMEAAVLIATWYWANIGQPRRRVVSLARGYHGTTVVSRTLSGLVPTGHGLRDPLPVTRVELPAAPDDIRRPEHLPALLAAFTTAIDDDADGPPAAVVVEPLLNVGGGIVLPDGFLRGLRELCDASGALLVLDEVFTGCGRTGRMFACLREDVEPDVLVVSKGLGSGYLPITAVVTNPEIHASFRRDPVFGGLRYGHTTSGHAVACAAALAALNVIESERLSERAEVLGRRLIDGLAPLTGTPQVVDVRGLGLVVTLQTDSVDTATSLVTTARSRGLLLRQQQENVMVIPPLILDEDGADQIVTRILGCLAEAA
ncbi:MULTISPECIES: aspartate aminotransferase family protein [unclassified Micromonospora]|uniref:aminotransferase family protein n=1 Tax=unclassified Micromonospora TaxID=2617518 RepID=UPI00098D542D|nr:MULTISPECIES: aminotransferase class III-fold pyridoxal phosphate-dependent enzyme [unclassified Micromonospora]